VALIPDRLGRWRVLTVTLMVTGYAGYYLCRSDLSVAMPLLIAEMASRGIAPDDARIRLGTIASLGVLAYATAVRSQR
jgi:OPA family glycerol-3-phosphate transporter-like MFS transporter